MPKNSEGNSIAPGVWVTGVRRTISSRSWVWSGPPKVTPARTTITNAAPPAARARAIGGRPWVVVFDLEASREVCLEAEFGLPARLDLPLHVVAVPVEFMGLSELTRSVTLAYWFTEISAGLISPPSMVTSNFRSRGAPDGVSGRSKKTARPGRVR
jgi:hypothetical protein